MLPRYLLAASLSLAALLAGCSDNRAKKIEGAKAIAAARDAEKPETWWCETHGVPKHICAQCDPKLAAAAQQKGDWCATHQRPKSQCFLCEPRLERRFAAMKNARFGKPTPQPPPGG